MKQTRRHGKRRMNVSFACAVFLVGPVTLGEAQGPHVMQPRVPPAQLEEAQTLTNPLPNSPEVVRPGKSVVRGKRHLCKLSRHERKRPGGRQSESGSTEFPPSWVLASPDGGRNLLGDQAWQSRHRHDSLWRAPFRQGDLDHHALRKNFFTKTRSAGRTRPPARERADDAKRGSWSSSGIG